MFVAAAVVFGLGFGSAYPVFAAYVIQHVGSARRGAAFGSILAALDTGIGSGSIVLGWIIQQHGFHMAFAAGAAVAGLAVPYFLAVRPYFVRLSHHQLLLPQTQTSTAPQMVSPSASPVHKPTTPQPNTKQAE
jgi:MFS family permease